MKAFKKKEPFILPNSNEPNVISLNYTYDLPIFGKIKSVKFPDAEKITNVLISKSEKIIVAYNNCIKLLMAPEYNITKTMLINSHLTIKFLVLLNDNILISCTNDNNIQIWKEYEDIYAINHQFKGDDHRILQVISMSNNQFGCFTKDNSITMWDINNLSKSIKTLQIKEPIKAIYQMKNGTLIAFIKGAKMQVLENDRFNCIYEMNNIYYTRKENICETNDNKLLICLVFILVINLKSFQIETSIKLNQYIYCMNVMNKTILCGGNNGKIFYIDYENIKIKKENNIKSKAIMVQIIQSKTKVISIFDNKEIQIFNNNLQHY